MWLICEDGNAINSAHICRIAASGNGDIWAIETTGKRILLVNCPDTQLAAIGRLTTILNDADGHATIDLSQGNDRAYVVEGKKEEEEEIWNIDGKLISSNQDAINAYRQHRESTPDGAMPIDYVQWFLTVYPKQFTQEG